MLRAYFDDSGTHDGSPVCTVGGYIAGPERWDECQPEWDECLRVFNEKNQSAIRYFHMADCIGGYEEFKGLTPEARAFLMAELIRLAKDYSIRGIGAVLPMKDYREVVGDPEKRLAGVPAPFTLCAEGSFMMTKGWALSEHRPDPIAFFIEKGTKHRGEILSGFDRAIKRREWGGAFALDSIAQGPKELVGLQMADLYAWTLGAEVTGRLPLLSEPFKPLIKFLNDDHPHEHWPWSRLMLEVGALQLLVDLKSAELSEDQQK